MEEEKVVHIVQEGENLGELTKYYTGGNNYGEVAQNNGISDPNKIYVGQKIEFSVSGSSEYANSNPGVVNNSDVSTQTETSTQTEANVQQDTSTQTETSTQNGASTQTEANVQPDTSTQTEATTQNEASTQTEANTQQETTSQSENTAQNETSTQEQTTVQNDATPQTGNDNQQNANQQSTNQNTPPQTNTNSRSYSNKWLISTCHTANAFNVDKTHTDFYIGYLDSKQVVTAINDSWKNIKSQSDTLKNNIDALKQAIDSQDYKKKTTDIINAIDNSMTNLDKNFNSLFNSVVNRLIEAAATDEWFSETAIQYATFISETILGKPAPVIQNNNATPASESDTTQSVPAESETIATP